ncbi:hypothetical protein ALQ20_03697, partial [Pseudomonas syringae pv. atrofaciens]
HAVCNNSFNKGRSTTTHQIECPLRQGDFADEQPAYCTIAYLSPAPSARPFSAPCLARHSDRHSAVPALESSQRGSSTETAIHPDQQHLLPRC